MSYHRIYIVSFSLILFGCTAEPETPVSAGDNEIQESFRKAPANPIIAAIEEAHQADSFHQKEAISFDIELFFRGQKRMDATITSMTNSSAIKLERPDGISVHFDGDKVYLSPDTATYPSARFDILTWQYFMLAPFKFSDPGTRWQIMSDMPLGQGQLLYPCAKLTFRDNTGDAPDDWYVAYQDPTSNRLAALAYIVTYNATQEEAEAEPHAITYDAYQAVAGIPFPLEWQFHLWNQADGLGEQIGQATITNIAFVQNPDFSIPESASLVTR